MLLRSLVLYITGNNFPAIYNCTPSRLDNAPMEASVIAATAMISAEFSAISVCMMEIVELIETIEAVLVVMLAALLLIKTNWFSISNCISSTSVISIEIDKELLFTEDTSESISDVFSAMADEFVLILALLTST